MAIEIVPGQKPKTPVLIIVLSVIAAVLLLGLAGSYFYLKKAEEKITNDIRDKEKVLAKTPSEKSLEDGILLIEKKVSSFETLLAEHKNVVNVLTFLEGITHPKVWFSDFTLDVAKNTLQFPERPRTSCLSNSSG